MRPRISLFWSTVMALAAVYLLLRFGVAHISQAIVGAENPLPVPGALLAIYLILTFIGLGIYLGMREEHQREFTDPILHFLRGPGVVEGMGGWAFQGARWAALGLFPVLIGFLVYTQAAPKVASPTALRIQHPGLPKQFERLENPFRNVDPETRATYMEEGRVLFYMNCRPCHGTKADGTGPMARGFRLKPANFTDPGTIATVVEAFAFWRAKKGGLGLPVASSPWDSAMPVWERDLTDEEIWKIILAEYEIARVEPRKPERQQ